MLAFGTLSLGLKTGEKLRFFMKNNKICGKLRKGANFAAAILPLRPSKNHDDRISNRPSAYHLGDDAYS